MFPTSPVGSILMLKTAKYPVLWNREDNKTENFMDSSIFEQAKKSKNSDVSTSLAVITHIFAWLKLGVKKIVYYKVYAHQ